MVNLAELAQDTSYAQTSGGGFGTRMLCRPLTIHDEAPTDESLWLTGVRRANALNATTNPVVNAHMRSPGGFVEKDAGLRDPGDLTFEASYKNDRHLDANGVDVQAWQVPVEGQPDASQGFFHSFFYNRRPFEAWVIPPQWTRGIIVVRGYASMVGPFPHEMEAPVNFQASFAISGRPMMLRGALQGSMAPAMIDADERLRFLSDDGLFEAWTEKATMTAAPAWGEDPVTAYTTNVPVQADISMYAEWDMATDYPAMSRVLYNGQYWDSDTNVPGANAVPGAGTDWALHSRAAPGKYYLYTEHAGFKVGA